MAQNLSSMGLPILMVLFFSVAVISSNADRSDAEIPSLVPKGNAKYVMPSSITNEQQPPLVFPNDEKKYKIINGNPETLTIAPREFPKDDKKFKIINGNPSSFSTVPEEFPINSKKFKILNGNLEAMSSAPSEFPNDDKKFKIINGSLDSLSTVPNEFPKDSAQYKVINGNIETWSNAPKEFPSDEKKYRIVLNSTSTSSGKAPSVFPEDKTKFHVIESNFTIIKSLIHKDLTVDTIIKNGSEKSSDFLKNMIPKASLDLGTEFGDVIQKGAIVQHKEIHGHVGRWVFVALSVFVILIVFGYAAFITWRRKIGSRFNSRHILINEEDPVNEYKHSEF